MNPQSHRPHSQTEGTGQTNEREHSVAEMLHRLVGPGGPRVTCEECFTLLSRYVDLQLGGEDVDVLMPGLRAHLDDCLGCFEGYTGLAAIVRLLEDESDDPGRITAADHGAALGETGSETRHAEVLHRAPRGPRATA